MAELLTLLLRSPYEVFCTLSRIASALSVRALSRSRYDRKSVLGKSVLAFSV